MSKAIILYIEDNLDNRTLIRRILSAEGYDMKEAGNAGDAKNILEFIRPDFNIDGYKHARY